MPAVGAGRELSAGGGEQAEGHRGPVGNLLGTTWAKTHFGFFQELPLGQSLRASVAVCSRLSLKSSHCLCHAGSRPVLVGWAVFPRSWALRPCVGAPGQLLSVLFVDTGLHLLTLSSGELIQTRSAWLETWKATSQGQRASGAWASCFLRGLARLGLLLLAGPARLVCGSG